MILFFFEQVAAELNDSFVVLIDGSLGTYVNVFMHVYYVLKNPDKTSYFLVALKQKAIHLWRTSKFTNNVN